MVDAQQQMSQADEYAAALIAAMLGAEDSGDPAEWRALMEQGSKSHPASMVISSLTSQAATLIRILAGQQQVPWQTVLQTLDQVSEATKGRPKSP